MLQLQTLPVSPAESNPDMLVENCSLSQKYSYISNLQSVAATVRAHAFLCLQVQTRDSSFASSKLAVLHLTFCVLQTDFMCVSRSDAFLETIFEVFTLCICFILSQNVIFSQ